ncbi:MAG: hypothetical protein B9S34_06530 [Opitutia bacterium Tous-C1TDCM]|nr:MAG: hypothetical protein B9S34_06530 [Opitutae bacterium Tous-C1TDCM]
MTAAPRPARRRQRGSLLLSAMLIAISMGAGLVGYLQVSRNALQLAQRTYYLNDAAALAEAGLEEAAYCFRQIELGTAVNTVWNAWTTSGSNATITLPQFSRGQGAIGRVKVFVSGFNGSVQIPYVISQATVTPLDGSPPITKTLRIGLKKRGAYNAALVASNGIDFGSNSVIDSFNSNPSGISGSTPLAYPGNGAASAANVIVLGGDADFGSSTLLKGSLMLAAGVASPPANQVTGTIVTNYAGTFPLPSFPSLASINRGYLLFTVPATLPRSGDSPASDGRFYYFPLLDNIDNTTVTAGKNVTVVCAGVRSKITIQAGASLIVYTYGTINTSGDNAIVNNSWAGALQIFTSTTSRCDVGNNGNTLACIYAPNAEVRLNGGGSDPRYVGAVMAKSIKTHSNLKVHYDEALLNSSMVVGVGYTLSTWYDLQGTADAAGLSALTGGFLL